MLNYKLAHPTIKLQQPSKYCYHKKALKIPQTWLIRTVLPEEACHKVVFPPFDLLPPLGQFPPLLRPKGSAGESSANSPL